MKRVLLALSLCMICSNSAFGQERQQQVDYQKQIEILEEKIKTLEEKEKINSKKIQEFEIGKPYIDKYIEEVRTRMDWWLAILTLIPIAFSIWGYINFKDVKKESELVSEDLEKTKKELEEIKNTAKKAKGYLEEVQRDRDEVKILSYINKAESYYDKEEYNKAIEKFTEAQKICEPLLNIYTDDYFLKKYVYICSMKASSYFFDKQYKKALECQKKVINNNDIINKNFRTLLNIRLANMYLTSPIPYRDYKESLKIYKEYLSDIEILNLKYEFNIVRDKEFESDYDKNKEILKQIKELFEAEIKRRKEK